MLFVIAAPGQWPARMWRQSNASPRAQQKPTLWNSQNTPIRIHKHTFTSTVALARAYTLVSTITFAATLTTTLTLMGPTACTYSSAIAPHDPEDTFTTIVTEALVLRIHIHTPVATTSIRLTSEHTHHHIHLYKHNHNHNTYPHAWPHSPPRSH